MAQCQDNSKLMIPLEQVCSGSGTPVNCIPNTDGKPTWTPTTDQLGIAFDHDAQTIWLYDCDRSDWYSLSTTSLCDLTGVNLDNIGNLCTILNIPVVYQAAGQCVEGTITLQEFAEKMVECITICSWDTMTQGQVDAAASTMLAACVDGDEVLIPVPEIPDTPTIPDPYACVPITLTVPVDPPADGEGPFKIMCDGHLYAWICDQDIWMKVTIPPGYPVLDPNDVTNPCDDLNFMTWYGTGCPEVRELTLQSLADLVADCLPQAPVVQELQYFNLNVEAFSEEEPATSFSENDTIDSTAHGVPADAVAVDYSAEVKLGVDGSTTSLSSLIAIRGVIIAQADCYRSTPYANGAGGQIQDLRMSNHNNGTITVRGTSALYNVQLPGADEGAIESTHAKIRVIGYWRYV